VYAPPLDGSPRPDAIDEATPRYRARSIPAARARFRGFAGLDVLADRASGAGLVIALDASETDARRVETSGQFAEAVAALRDLLARPPTRAVREVVFHDRAGAARYARVTDAAMDAARLDQATAGGGGGSGGWQTWRSGRASRCSTRSTTASAATGRR
jgi:hypothetical protein